MEDPLTIPYCEPPPSDVIPMLVTAAVFVLGWWLIRRWKKKRGSSKRNS